jgi:hypothetical protein
LSIEFAFPVIPAPQNRSLSLNTSEELPMTRKTASDFHPQALKLFDQYVHGLLSRRIFCNGRRNSPLWA